jgi:NTE family protein
VTSSIESSSNRAAGHPRRIGLALGGGSARGWAHVGVIRGLLGVGIQPDLVCGTSIGALTGAAFAAGELDRFQRWVEQMRVAEVMSFLDLTLGGGLVKGGRLMDFFRRNFTDRTIESLALPFGAVATALHTGAEVWLREGSTVDAVRASIALPVLFTPVARDGELLVDGGLVNPVPVSLARAMGADIVIAVDLNSDLLGRHLGPIQRNTATDSPAQPADQAAPVGQVSELLRRLQAGVDALRPSRAEGPSQPSLFDVLASSINIMQVRITRSRMAGDPPDVVIAPRVAHLALLDFHRGPEAIEAGRRAVELALPQLRDLGLAR